MQIAVLGLGNMGLNLALNMQQHGYEVWGWNRSELKREAARAAGLTHVEDDLASLMTKFTGRRVIWLMVSAGSAIDQLLFEDQALVDMLQPGDVIIDGANSHFQHSQQRGAKLAEKGIKFLDCGVSGGIEGARNGACVMVGGERQVYDELAQLFTDVALPGGAGYFGKLGAGHYVKMVHNAIEYGMMQSIAEGLNLIAHTDLEVDLAELVAVWNHGSIIQSRLLDFMHQALQRDGRLSHVDPEVGSLGTGMWASQEALARGVPFTSNTHAVFSRYVSNDKDSMIFKAIQAMRAEFGGHDSQERPAN